MMKLSELTQAAQRFADAHGDTLQEPAGTHDGMLLFSFMPAGCEPGGCYGLPQYILVDVETGEARYQTGKELVESSVSPFLENLGPIPD